VQYPESEEKPAAEPAPRPVPCMPWENPTLGFVGRYWGTLGNALAPAGGVPQLCAGRLSPALSFALLSAVPLMLAWGVVPFTKTLLFGGGFHVTRTPDATKFPLWIDVTRAMGVSLGMSLLAQLAWTLPFISLLRAFADPRIPPQLSRLTAERFSLYRAWLVPGGLTLLYLLAWTMPNPEQPGFLAALASFACLVAPVWMMFIGAQATARAFGASTLGSLAVALVPVLLQQVVGQLLNVYALQFAPPLPLPH
jgi:hypothetical protein